MLLVKGYAAISITGLLATTYMNASLYIKAKRNNTLKEVYDRHKTYGQFEEIQTFEESGLTKMSDFELAIYGAYENFGSKVIVCTFWPFIIVYLTIPYIAYKRT